MTVRVHRKRLMLIIILVICILIYLNHFYFQNSILNENKIELSSIVQEQFIEINGKNLRKIDWHDYEFIKQENVRTGLGEGGTGVEVTIEERNSAEYHELYRTNGFNAFVSNRISLDRSLNDLRHIQCKSKLYLAKLPSVSVIIPIYNEHLTTLLRSIHSILNRTPAKLLEEILLVDDGSDQIDMKISNLTKIRLIRLGKRHGSIRAKLAGARLAKGDILIFFHSHIEVNVNWLPPLIEPIALNSKTSVCPFIDVIKSENFEYMAKDEGSRGAFDWSMSYKRLPLLSSQVENLIEPFENPVMANGIFAIDRKWFWELGGYDEDLEVSDGEQYEMSFKIWQCGGRVLDIPCSRIGHIYRQINLHNNHPADDYLLKNHKRIAAIWMDEYAEYVYKQNPRLQNIDPGDIRKQVQLREKLQCKSFKWYMENVAFDLLEYFPPIPPPSFAEGEIRSMAAPLCIDTKHGDEQAKFGLDHCMKNQQGQTGEQEFELTWRQDIRPKGRTVCFDVSPGEKHPSIILYNCHGMRGNQHFVYDINHFHLIHIASQLCLDCNLESKMIYMEQCDILSLTQQWIFSFYNKTLILKEMKELF